MLPLVGSLDGSLTSGLSCVLGKHLQISHQKIPNCFNALRLVGDVLQAVHNRSTHPATEKKTKVLKVRSVHHCAFASSEQTDEFIAIIKDAPSRLFRSKALLVTWQHEKSYIRKSDAGVQVSHAGQ